MTLSFRHLVSASQVTRPDADFLMERAGEIVERVGRGEPLTRLKGYRDACRDKCIASLFYEESTRTRVSFERSIKGLGSDIVTAQDFKASSLYKGESIWDNTKIMAGYDIDAMIMRHQDAGSAQVAADALDAFRHETGRHVPFINAGDGENEHPTQALLDIFTIQQECRKLAGLHVAMAGDLKFGRTVHSLVKLLSLYPDMRFTFASPQRLKIPDYIREELVRIGIPFTEVSTLEEAIDLDPDVNYMTRVQKKRFEPDNLDEYERLKDSIVLKAPMLKGKDNMVIMHPLPRVMELDTAVDALPNAAYFRQAANGIPMRMAIIREMLNVQQVSGESDMWYQRRLDPDYIQGVI